MKIVKDKKYSNMYRLKWKNGDLSADCYNKSRASWYCKSEYIINMTEGSVYNAAPTSL